MLGQEQRQNRRLYVNCLIFLIIILLILGLFFRLVNLDKKVYWGDETATSIRISGYTFTEVGQLFEKKAMSTESAQKYQYPTPEKNLLDVYKGLATEEPQLTPFYFTMVRFWVQWLDNSVAVTRSFSALISLLAFPCIYWLCQELFAHPLTGCIAMVLIAISPLHVLYAQEARPYSLWTVTILLSSVILLRAIRLKTISSWIAYAIAVTLGFYTFLLSGLVFMAHGVYVAISENFQFSKVTVSYLLSFLSGFLLFLPWVFNIIVNSSNVDRSTGWTRLNVYLPSLVRTWMLNLSRTFFDLNNIFTTKNIIFYLLIIALVIYAIYFIFCQNNKRAALFIVTIIGVNFLFLALPDLIFGGRRSAAIRYLFPCYMAIEIAVAHLLATKIDPFLPTTRQLQLWQLLTVALIFSGVLSCAIISQSETWWNKGTAFFDSKVANIVNQSERPLLIHPSGIRLLSLSHVLAPQIKLQNPPNLEVSYLKNNFSDIFVYQNKSSLKYLLEKYPNLWVEKTYHWKWQINPVSTVETTLWKMRFKDRTKSE